MNKLTSLKILNPILFILLIYVASTGLGHDLIKAELFEKIHPGGGVLLIIAAVIHLFLNWGWIKSNLLKR